MGRGQRVGLILAAVAVAVVAFVLLRPSGDDDAEPTRQGRTTEETRPQDGGETQESPQPAPQPKAEVIRIKDGAAAGGERRIRLSKGDTARIDVRADVEDEIHVHGYDLKKRVRPGSPARFRFKADIEGVFEIEAHDLGHLIVGTLVVEP